MTDTHYIPMSASADGKTNAYVLQCPAAGQAMNYAACLHRLDALKADEHPRDWAGCRSAQLACQCPAQAMREEEELQGRSLYFRAREAVQAAVATARKWFMPGDAPMPKAMPRRAGSRLDALAHGGTYADALTAAAGDAATPATPRPVIPIAVAMPGETPLQIARRLKAERDAAAAL